MCLAGELELDGGQGVRHTGATVGRWKLGQAWALWSPMQASLGHLRRLGRAAVGAGLGAPGSSPSGAALAGQLEL